MEESALVSVIVTTYNQEKYILETLNSILKQEANFVIEVIISNDCSPDNSHSIIDEFVKNNKGNDRFVLKYFKHSSNIGAALNFDFAYKETEGKYIAFCEGDDYWIDNSKLQKQVDFLESNQDYNLVYTDAKYYKQKTEEFDLQRTQQISGFDDLLVKNRIFTLTVCLRREILDVYMQEDVQDLNDLPFGDYPLWLFASTRGKAKYLPIVSAVYRILEESASHSKCLTKMVDFEEALNKCRFYFLYKYYKGDKVKLSNKFLGSKTRSIVKLSFIYKDEEIFKKYKNELKYIAYYKYKYYLIYSLARIDFKSFVAVYNYFAKP